MDLCDEKKTELKLKMRTITWWHHSFHDALIR